MELKFNIPLPPVTKKNSQQILINRATGRPFVMPSKKFKQYEQSAKPFLKKLPVPIDYPVNVKCLFYLPTKRRTDMTNLLEAVDDLLVSAGILADDHYGIVAGHDGSRCYVDRDLPRTEIVITKMTEESP